MHAAERVASVVLFSRPQLIGYDVGRTRGGPCPLPVGAQLSTPHRQPMADGTLRRMVRPDERRTRSATARRVRRSGWTPPGGVSPLPVSVGAPGSRSQARGEILVSRAGRRKPVMQRELRSGKQARGPQHEVKPAASSQLRSGSRAAHVTAKAMPVALVPKRATGSGGVGGAARVQGGVRNWRGPSGQPSSRRSDPYKPKVKAVAGQRESEGVIGP